MSLVERRLRHLAAVGCMVAVAGAWACGKKGPPLPPFAQAPAAPPDFSARRQGDRVVVRFTVPQADLDGRRPANIDRVEVYALTSDTAPLDIVEKYGETVAEVAVEPPPPPPPDVEEGQPPPPPAPPRQEPGLARGEPAEVTDLLSPEDLVPVVIPEVEEARQEEAELRARRLREVGLPALTPPDLGPPIPDPPRRFYVARGRNGRRKGGWTPRVPVPIGPAPPAPAAPAATVAAGRLELNWAPITTLKQPVQRPTMAAPAPVGARPASQRPVAMDTPAPAASSTPAGLPIPAPLAAEESGEDDAPAGQEAAAPAAPAPAPELSSDPTVVPSRLLTAWPITTTGYVVDEIAPPGFEPPALEPGAVPPYPVRLTPTPLAVPAHAIAGIAYGVERCFVVRTVETTGNLAVESEASPVTCVTPADTFPPAAPADLAAVASEGAISLIWEPSPAADLLGYIVLRGPAGAESLEPLMEEAVRDTTYRDTTVTPGIRYVYAVVAIDNARPPNVSAPSNRVEETAR